MFKRIMGRQCLQSGSIILLWVFWVEV
jgi:hypothetical protein